MTIKTMPDQLLLESYQKALFYQLDHAFIELLLEEITKRDLQNYH